MSGEIQPTALDNPGSVDLTAPSDSHVAASDRLVELGASIRDLADDLNRHKARTGAMIGGAVFLLLLGGGAAYDIVRGNFRPWLFLGLDKVTLEVLAGCFIFTALLLIVVALRLRPGDRKRELILNRLEREYDELSND
jgi:hypothetical protein